jgi:hypothetical protein
MPTSSPAASLVWNPNRDVDSAYLGEYPPGPPLPGQGGPGSPPRMMSPPQSMMGSPPQRQPTPSQYGPPSGARGPGGVPPSGPGRMSSPAILRGPFFCSINDDLLLQSQ